MPATTKSIRSSCGSGSTSAISSSKVKISMATASTSRRDSRESPNPAAFACLALSTSRSPGRSPAFTEVGVCNLKNIDTPIHVFQVGERAEGSQTSTLPPLISDRPSIAVLPFSNLSENRNIELLADGLVEDVIALLARVPGFFVISRSSSFAYRNTTQNVRYVGCELGVRYVVEGSIRASDKRARISTQLVEGRWLLTCLRA